MGATKNFSNPSHSAVCLAVGIALGVFPIVGLSQSSGDLLEEVTVTATRQAVAINRVAMSIAAVTSESIERQGLQDVQDLARSVPSMTFRRSGSDGNPSVSIRGIGSVLGSPTTGVYLDDVPIQKRDTNGAVTGNGSPFPLLFDLDRVEVLRGPQGTLYGGSAQGGAIRFITPTPSLTEASGAARAQVSTLAGGSLGYEYGVAAGGPLIEDKLGVRVSAFKRRQGGYLDHVSLYTGEQFAKDTNWREGHALRGSLLWKATDSLQLTPSIYYSVEKLNNNDTYYRDIPEFTLASGIFTNRGTTFSGVAYDFPDTYFEGGTFGPLNYYGRYKTPQGYYPTTDDAQLATSPRQTTTVLPVLTVDYDFGPVTLKSITSYLRDETSGSTAGTAFGHRTQVFPVINTNAQFVAVDSVGASCTGANVSSITDDGICRVPIPGGVGSTVGFIPGIPYGIGVLDYDYFRTSKTEEIRLQSAPGDGRMDWIAGFFVTQSDYLQKLREFGNEQQRSIALRGVGEEWFMGQVNFDVHGDPLPVGAPGMHAYRQQYMTEKEMALFGEVNFNLTESLKLTAGLRASKVDVDYLQYIGASVFSNPAGFVGTPGAPERITSPTEGHPFANQPGDPKYNIVEGVQSEKPISPKLSLAYQMTPTDLFYATYSTGYRAGGVNQPASPANCGLILELLGLSGTPTSFKSDTVTNYEVGAKNRMLGMQLNTSLYYVKWDHPQVGQRLTQCGHAFIDNAGAAVSKGFDVEASTRIVNTTLQGSVAYTDARYTETVYTPVTAGATPQIVVRSGDELGAPKWQFSASIQQDFNFGARPFYVRADYQYSGKYLRTTGPGTISYQALAYQGESGQNLNMRAGMKFGQLEAAAFVNNLTGEHTVYSVGNTAGSSIVTETAARPRETGVSLSYRF